MEIINALIYMLGEMAPYILLGFGIAGLMKAFVGDEVMARHFSGRGLRHVVKAAAVGVPLPLCSCGVLPTAIGMRRGGASRASATSFLIATPQTGVDSIAATWSLLGPGFAVVRPIAALLTAVGGGWAVGRYADTDAPAASGGNACSASAAAPSKPFLRRLAEGLKYGFVDLVGSIGGWLIAGLIIAALITVFVPERFFEALGGWPLLSMIGVVVIAIPMYVCATGSIPIAMSLVMKGLSPGTALVLLMAGPAANFASFGLISREMGRKAALIYVGAIVVGAIGMGLIIDYLLPASWFMIPGMGAEGACHHGAAGLSLLDKICAGVLVALLGFSYIRRFFNTTNINSEMTKEYLIEGMNCQHCQGAVKRAIEGVEGVTAAEVDLGAARARVEGEHSSDAVLQAVRAAGFDARPA